MSWQSVGASDPDHISSGVPTGTLRLRRFLLDQLNRDMPEGVHIRLKVWWPVILIPFALINQVLAPHPVWLALLVSLLGLYGIGLVWVRVQAPGVSAVRRRTGSFLVAGDTLHEDFELVNNSRLPVIWVEFIDQSDLPGHSAGRIVACGALSFYRWASEATCQRRGAFRLGPHRLRLGDPFGLFEATIASDSADVVLIYPRVVHLPEIELPHGNAGESRRRRRPLYGALPSASVNEYTPGDSLRRVHWRSTARRSRLMVKELEIEPSGDVWIVLDMNRAAHSGTGQQGTLEYSVIVAASLAARLLSEGERRAVGLLTVSGDLSTAGQPQEAGPSPTEERGPSGSDDMLRKVEQQAVLAPPQPGQAQLWRILTALAPVEPTNVTLAELLRNSREVLGSRRTLVVITPQVDVDSAGEGFRHRVVSDGAWASTLDASVNERPDSVAGEERTNWLPELAHLRSSGLDSTVLLIALGGEELGGRVSQSTDVLRGFLAREDIASAVLYSNAQLKSALTFRRTKRVIRSTPTGGVVSYEVEEEVG